MNIQPALSNNHKKTQCFVFMHTCGLSPFAFQRNLVQPFSQEPQRHGHHIPLRHTQNQPHQQPPSTTTLSYSTQLWLKSRYGLVVILLYLLPHMCKTLVKRNTTAVTVVTCVEVLQINHNHHGNLLFHMGLLHSNTVTMVTCSSHGSVAQQPLCFWGFDGFTWVKKFTLSLKFSLLFLECVFVCY